MIMLNKMYFKSSSFSSFLFLYFNRRHKFCYTCHIDLGSKGFMAFSAGKHFNSYSPVCALIYLVFVNEMNPGVVILVHMVA